MNITGFIERIKEGQATKTGYWHLIQTSWWVISYFLIHYDTKSASLRSLFSLWKPLDLTVTPTEERWSGEEVKLSST